MRDGCFECRRALLLGFIFFLDNHYQNYGKLFQKLDKSNITRSDAIHSNFEGTLAITGKQPILAASGADEHWSNTLETLSFTLIPLHFPADSRIALEKGSRLSAYLESILLSCDYPVDMDSGPAANCSPRTRFTRSKECSTVIREGLDVS